MSLLKALLIFAFVVCSIFVAAGVRWLLNQPNDLMVILAGFLTVLFLWISFKTKAFTKNPFVK